MEDDDGRSDEEEVGDEVRARRRSSASRRVGVERVCRARGDGARRRASLRAFSLSFSFFRGSLVWFVARGSVASRDGWTTADDDDDGRVSRGETEEGFGSVD